MKQITREDYMETLISLRDKDVIKVITGVRRCGKSTIMQMYKDYLLSHGAKKSQIVFMNFESFENKKWLNDLDGLYNHIVKQLDLSKPCYVFLDEVQNVNEFERLVDGLFVKPNVDVYVTGSNAYLLSSELGTLLTGRYVSIHVLPFSFKEFLKTQSDVSRIDLLFQKYMHGGGMPGIFDLPSDIVSAYISDILNNIIQKDVLVRNKWKNAEHFNKTTAFLFDCIGSPISSKKITNSLLSNGVKISHNTVGDYLNALTESYLFYRVNRFDLKGKGLLSTQEKYYAVDLSFKSCLLGSKVNFDLGHNLENIVFLEFLRRKNKVYIGKANNLEIDFVAQSPKGETEYIQVAYTAKEKDTLERELKPFSMVKDFNKRTLITTDVEPELSFNGIRKINAIDWLLANMI
jgi:predicted AAA+ superfamily ATPase